MLTAASSDGRQPPPPVLQGVGHQHRQCPLVLEGPPAMSRTQDVAGQAAQQDSPVQLVQSSKVTFTCTHGEKKFSNIIITHAD